MILKIAWKNIWRSRARSFVVIGSVVVGVWAFIYMMAFVTSLSKGYVDNAIRFQTSDIQIHDPQFTEDREVKYLLDPSYLETVQELDEVDKVALRTVVDGMVSSSHGARGVTIKGVSPDQESALTGIDEKLVEGTYFQADKSHQLLIGKKLLDKLNVRLRKKVVLQFQDLSGAVVSGSFRVTGIFDTGNTQIDEQLLIVDRAELDHYLRDPDAAHEIAILLHDRKSQLASVQEELQNSLPTTKVETFKELSPDIELFDSQLQIMATFLLAIFMLALIFGIINTMLMAILERTREIGMLMAVGMSKGSIFKMIMLETFFLSVIGAPIGMFLGWLSVRLSSDHGIDLSRFAKGIAQLGFDTVIHPQLEMGVIAQLTVAVLITAILAAFFPAYRAITMRPLDAIHSN